MRKSALLLSASLASCTLATDAGGREIVQQLDIQLTMTDMSPHATTAVDVALVSESKGQTWLRGRGRVIMPPVPVGADPSQPPPPYPAEVLTFSRAYVRDEPFSLLFYADTDDDYQLRLPLANEPLNREHSWINEVPSAGAVSFAHSTDFSDFRRDAYQSIGRDVTFAPPDVGALGQRAACYDELLARHVQTALEVRVIYHPDTVRTQVGVFKTYRGNGLPKVAVRLEGISDTGSEYDIERLSDGEVRVVSQSTATEQGLTLAFAEWFPAPVEELAACAALL